MTHDTLVAENRSSSPETIMTYNESTLDRTLRILAGVARLYLTFDGRIGALGWLGFVPLITGIVGYCPLYSLFGWSTCKRDTHAAA